MRLGYALLACIVLLLFPAAWQTARADTPVELGAMTLDRSDDGIYLSASIQFDLPAIVDDALRKGIPMHFVAEAELMRDRWYWYDRKVSSATRYMRLAYQPLTRRWRLNVAPTPITNTGLGTSLGQTFDTLPEALAAIQRISRWRIADPADVDADVRHTLDFRFRLDVSQLPRPFQIGVAGQGDWVISVSRSQRVLEAAR